MRKTAGFNVKKQQRNFASVGAKFQNGNEDPLASGLDNPDLGPFLLKHTKDMISSGENPKKTLEFALRATKSLEVCMTKNLI